jgi:hypothetical protein
VRPFPKLTRARNIALATLLATLAPVLVVPGAHGHGLPAPVPTSGAATISVGGAASWRFYPGRVVTWQTNSTVLAGRMPAIAAFLAANGVPITLHRASTGTRPDIELRTSTIYSCATRLHRPGGVGGPGQVFVGADCRGLMATSTLAHELGHALGHAHVTNACAGMNPLAITNPAETNARPSRCASFHDWTRRPFLPPDVAKLRAYWTNRPPTANFTLPKTTWEIGESLRAIQGEREGMLDTSNDPDWNISSEQVDWGDGSTPTAFTPPGRWVVVPNWPAHAYQAAGTLTITLTVTDSYGVASTRQQQVTVTDPTGGTGVIWV